MGPYLDSILEVMVERPPQEWIGGLMIALFLALALAGAHTALRRWTKVQEDTTPLVGLGVVVIFAAMVLASVSAELRLKQPDEAVEDASERSSGGPGRVPGSGSGPGRGFFTSRMADRILENADDNHDGRLSPEEAASAAGKFIAEAEENADGEAKLDRDGLIELLRENLRSSGGPPPPSPEPDPAAAPGDLKPPGDPPPPSPDPDPAPGPMP